MNNLKRLSPGFAILGALLLTMNTSCGPGNTSTTTATTTTSTSETPGTQVAQTVMEKYCAGYNNSPSQCRDKTSLKCTYDWTKKKCFPAQAVVSGDCGAITDASKCASEPVPPYGCRWDPSVTPSCIKNEEAKTIHVWNKLANPNDAIPRFKNIVMSGDGSLYGLNTEAGSMGLWYKAKNEDWAVLSISQGSPRTGATPTPLLAIASRADIDAVTLHATKDGAAVHRGTQVVLLKGGDTAWALDTSIHHDAATLAANRVADVVANARISFSAVVNTGNFQALLFQQSPEVKLVFKSTENVEDELKVMNLATPSGSAINIRLSAAANDENNGLVLGGENTDLIAIRKWIVHHISPEHNNPGGAGAGITVSEVPVLFSSRDVPLAGIVWKNDESTTITLVGKVGEYYFANRVGKSGATDLGGLYTHKGPQETGVVGTNPIITFGTSMIKGVKKFDNALLMVTEDQGLLGANAKLEPDIQKDFHFATYQASKDEMMGADRKEIELSGVDDKNLSKILGDDEMAYFVIKGKGIYSRTKEQGQPRL